MKAFLKKGLTFLIALAVIAQASILTPALTLTTYAETEETVEETVTNDNEDADTDIDADAPEEAAPDMIQEDVTDDASDEDEEDLVVEEAQSEETVEETITDDTDVAAIVPEVQVDIDVEEAVVEEPADEVIVEEETEDNPIRAGPSGETILAFTSDVHYRPDDDSKTRLSDWIDSIESNPNYGSIDYMGFCGDMGNGSGSDTAAFWTYTGQVMQMVSGKGIPACYTTGNHEYGPGDYNYSSHSSSTNSTVAEQYTVDASPDNIPSGANYQIYCMGSASKTQAYTTAQIAELEEFLDGASKSKPIFILTHFPLHINSSRSTQQAEDVINALNDAADEGKTIVFLWGHNHSQGDSNYDKIFSPGQSITYATDTSKPIKFYYAAAGCMSNYSSSINGKGLVVTISNNRAAGYSMTMAYLDVNGNELTSNNSSATVTVKGTTTFVQTDELVAGNEYIIAGEADSDGNVLMLSNESTGTAKQLKAVSANVSNNTITISDDDVLSKVLFFCEEDNTYSLGGMQLLSGGSYLYSSNSDGLSMHAKDAGRCWHYKAYDGDTDRHILWLIKESNGADGWTSAGGTYKYYLNYSSGYFTDGHVENNNTVQGTSGLPKIYLYVEAPEGDTYTLSYDANGGTGSMSSQTNKTTYTIKTNSFTKEGFEFTKWNTQADGHGTDYEPGDSITLTEDTTLYAQWTKATTVDHTVYVLTNSLTVGKKYLIVNTNAATSADGAHAIGMNGSAVADDSVTVNAGIAATNNTVYIDSDDVDATTAWTVGGSSTSPTFSQGSSYLYPSSSGVSISTTSRAWTAPGTSSTNHYLRYASGTTTRYLNYNNGWTMTSSSSSSTYQVYFYEEATIKVSITPGITVEPESATVGIGETKTLTATPKNVEGTPTITWSSSDTDVATVDQTGVVTGVAAGTATITASMTYEGETYTDTCVVTVKQVNTLTYDYIAEAVTGTAYVIVSNGYALVNNNGAVAAVPATVNGNTVTLLDDEYAEANMLWTYDKTSSDEPYFKNGNFYITRQSGSTELALTLGDSTSTKYTNWNYNDDGDQIIVLGGNNSTTSYYMYYKDGSGWMTYTTANGTTKLYGRTVAVTNVILPATATVVVGGTTTLTATVLPEDATNKNLSWSSSNESFATVDNNGTVTGVAEGTVTITATSVVDPTKYAECEVTVNKVPVESVTLNKNTAEVMETKTLQLTATVLPENATYKDVTWTSGDESVATVDQTGKVTGVAVGETTTITATADGVSATCFVTVTEYVAPTGYVILIDGYALSNVHAADNVELVNSTNYHYKGLNGVEYTEAVANNPPDSILWTITETTGGYYIQDSEGNYLNAVYNATTNPTGCNADLKVDDVQDVWKLEGTLEDWLIDGSTLKSTIADKSMTYEESVPIFTIRSTGETSTLEDPAHPITTETIYVETDSLTAGKKYIVAAANNDTSVYALNNSSGSVVAKELTVTPASGTDEAYITLTDEDTGVVWNYTNSSSNYYFINDSQYLRYDRNDSYILKTTTSSSSATSTTLDGQYLKMSSRYVARDGNSFNANRSSTSGASTFRIFIEKKVIAGPSITLDKSTMTVPLGETGSLIATPKNVEGTPTITWSSDDTDVATVDQNGVVTGVATGTATITASMTYESETYTATCEVTVKQVNTLTFEYVDEAVAGTSYVIVSNGYALVNNNGAVAAVQATVTGDTVTLYDDEFAEANMLWTVGDDGSLSNNGVYVRRASGSDETALTLNSETATSYTNWSYTGEQITVYSTNASVDYYMYFSSGWKTSRTANGTTKLYEKVVAPHEHTYGTPEYTWTQVEGGYTCTATATCTSCDEGTEGHTVTEEGTISYVVATPASCTAVGSGTYTATFENGLFETKTKDVEIPMIDHDLEHHDSVAATCTTAGNIEYWQCTVCGTYFSDVDATNEISQAETVIAIDENAHSWKLDPEDVTWSWNGVTSATATFTCEHNAQHIHTETATGAAITSADGTGDYVGYTVYTATVAFSDHTYTNDKAVINQYTLTFMDGETEVGTVTKDYGAAITEEDLPAEPSKAFYTFAGWDEEVPDTMPPENMTFHATWTAIEGYYLIGSMTGEGDGWQLVESYRLTVNPDDDSEYSIGTTLAVGDQIKVVRAVGEEKIDWYPSPEHQFNGWTTDSYTVDADHAGGVTLYFRPNGNNDSYWEPFGGFFYIAKDHTITVVDDGHGTAEAYRSDSTDPATNAPVGKPITVEYTPAEGYQLDKIELWKTNGGGSAETTLEGNTFNMPDYDVTIKVYFKLVTWQFVDFTWTGDDENGYTAAVANYNGSDGTTRTVNAVVEQATTLATCTQAGSTVYTATVSAENSLDGAPHTDSKTIVIPVLGHHMTSYPAVAPTCTTAGNSAYWYCDRCEKYFSDEAGTAEIAENGWVIPQNGHSYSVSAYAWVETADGYTCTAIAECGNCDSETEGHSITEEGAIGYAVTTPATCTATGIGTYTATFTNGLFETQTKTVDIPKAEHTVVEDPAVPATCAKTGLTAGSHCDVCGEVIVAQEIIPKADHTYGSPSYSWTETEDGYTCTAIMTCSVCDEGTEGHSISEEGAITEETIPATATQAGKITYTATFTNPLFETQTKEVGIPPFGYDVSYEWSEDNSSVTGTAVPYAQGAATVTETVNTTFVVTKEPTCTDTGIRTYTATFTNANILPTVTKEVEIGALGHDWKDPSWTWTGVTAATVTLTCGNNNAHVETVPADITFALGTGEDLGYTVYTATATLGDNTYTDTKKVANTFTVDDINGTFTYTGYAHEPEVTVKDGDEVLTLNTDYTVAYANNVNAGTATVTVTGKGNYSRAEAATKTFTIGKGTRNAPEVGHTDETIKGKADGTITGLTTEMQYKKDGEDYQTVTSDTLTGLEPGTYYVRYKETNNYLASEAATVEIAASTFQVAFSIELNDGIVVRTYVYNVPEGTTPSDYTLKYQYMDEAEGSYTLTKTTDKKIVATVNAPEMTEPVHVKLLYKGNEIYAKDYTVRDYCETQIRINEGVPEMKGMVDLCYALLDYGAFAQERFGVNTDKPANETYSRADEVLALTIPETLMTEDRKTSDITKVQTSLNLMSKTEMYFYFTPASGVKLSDITFEVQKKGVTTTEYTVSRKNGQAIVKVKGIAGPELGDTITVKAKVKGTLSDTVNASPISYLYTAQGVEGLENLSKAVYNYYLKADAYFN